MPYPSMQHGKALDAIGAAGLDPGLWQKAFDRVSVLTTRNQVKSLLGKTGCRRQAELALLVERMRRGIT